MSEHFSCSDLNVSRGPLTIVQSACLSLAPGQLAGLTGANGSGKTSLLETLAGVLPAYGGRIDLGSHRLDGLPAHARARHGLRLVRDHAMLFEDLSVRENLAIVRRSPDALAPPDLARLPLIAARLGQRAGGLSGGEKRIVAIVAALMAGPRLLLVDEFSEGLHTSVIPVMLGIIRHSCAQGMIAILTIHSAELIAREGFVRLEISRRLLGGGGLTGTGR